MTETGSRLLLGVAAVLAGTSVLLGVFGLVYNPVLLLAAVPFAVATYFLWSSATGRLDARIRERVTPRRAEEGVPPFGRAAPPGDGDAPGGGPGPRDPRWGESRSDTRRGRTSGRRPRSNTESRQSRSDAASVLGVDPAADDSEIRRAFREKARELHPDAPDGDEAEFRRVRTAYERLRDRP